MKLHGHYIKGSGDRDAFGHEGKRIVARDEDGIRLALKPCVDVGTEVLITSVAHPI